MMEFIEILKERNSVLFWFGTINLVVAFCFFLLSYLRPIEFAGTNAWYKPIKFALSTLILSWSIGWYIGYLPNGFDISLVNWTIVCTLAFEVIYIAWQAGKGEGSHYNTSSPFHAFMFTMMALAASIATITVAYLAIKFFNTKIHDLPDYYLWSIRLGMIIFVIFSFQGFVMGGNNAHTVGASDGSSGIPFLNWSMSYGDLRIAHFIGMHALQILPLLAFYFIKDLKWTIVTASAYAILAILVLLQALKGYPLFQNS